MKSIIWMPLVLLALASPAFAQDDACRDILVDGTMQNINLESSKYAKLAFMHRLYRMSEEEAKDEMRHIGSFDMLGYGIMADSDNVDQNYNKFKKIYEEELKVDLTRNEEIKLLAMSGDRYIVSAWNDCMRRPGMQGPRAYFESTQIGVNDEGMFATLSIAFNPQPGGELHPKIIAFEPSNLAFVSAEADRQIKVGETLVVNGKLTTQVYFPKVAEKDDSKTTYRDLQLLVHVDGGYSTLLASLPAVNEREAPQRTPWIRAGEVLRVHNATFCNRGATNNSGCNHKVENACKAMGLQFQVGLWEEQFCDHGGARCAVDFKCLHERLPGVVTVIEFQTLYPCNTRADLDERCDRVARDKCEILGLEFVQSFHATNPAQRDNQPLECKDGHLGECDVRYECTAIKDMY